jgi:hypothetical protein
MSRFLTNRTFEIVSLAILLAFFAPSTWAQKSVATQVVTLRVMELSKVDLVGGPLKLQVSKIDEKAFQPEPATDASTKLLWTSNGENRKITVASNATSSRFLLRIEADGVSEGSGIPANGVTLADQDPHDLILSVRRSAGSCRLKFTAQANAEQGIGTESHLLTYTITGD